MRSPARCPSASPRSCAILFDYCLVVLALCDIHGRMEVEQKSEEDTRDLAGGIVKARRRHAEPRAHGKDQAWSGRLLRTLIENQLSESCEGRIGSVVLAHISRNLDTHQKIIKCWLSVCVCVCVGVSLRYCIYYISDFCHSFQKMPSNCL